MPVLFLLKIYKRLDIINILIDITVLFMKYIVMKRKLSILGNNNDSKLCYIPGIRINYR